MKIREIGKIHAFIAKYLKLPLFAINITGISPSILVPDNYIVDYEVYLGEYTESSMAVTKCQIDDSDGFIKKRASGEYYLESTNCDFYQMFSYLPIREIDIEGTGVTGYRSCVKKLIALSLLPQFELSKFIYPFLFKNLDSRYTNFAHDLRNYNYLNKYDTEQQDIYIKLLTIFKVAIPVQFENIYYIRLLELNGMLVNRTSNKLYYSVTGEDWEVIDSSLDTSFMAIKYYMDICKDENRLTFTQQQVHHYK